MFYFLDSNAIVKRYVDESGSPIVNALFDKAGVFLLICDLSICEFVRVIERRRQRQEITAAEFDVIIKRFFVDKQTKCFSCINVNPAILHQASMLIIRNHLSVNDAIILAAVLSIRDLDPQFVCADEELLKTARAYKLNTINPMNP